MAGNLKLESFSDREILHMLNDAQGDEGWVDLDSLVSRVGISRNGKSEEAHLIYVHRCLSIRLSWIKRLSGTVEKEPKKATLPSRWRLTVSGQEVVKAKLSGDLSTKLESVGDFAALSALGIVARRYMRTDVSSANLLRREWQHGIHPNRRPA